jgi:pimeloyl-ACP methyl ester carboxylesterase
MLKSKALRIALTRRRMLQAIASGSMLPVLGGGPALAAGSTGPSPVASKPWLTLPATPTLPKPSKQGLAKLGDVEIYFAQFGRGPDVLMLHGGSANSNYWGHQVAELAGDFLVTVMDTRGHGRSPVSSPVFGYAQFAQDAVALLKYLGISRTAVVGWSDGAITGIQLAMVRPELLTGVFAFGANTDLHGLKPGGAKSPIFQQFSARCQKEYPALSPHPERWSELQAGLVKMWRSEPSYSRQQLAAIGVPVAVSDGEYDEIIKTEHTKEIAHSIPKSELALMSDVSHFAMLQDPTQFNAYLTEFLFGVV